MRRAKTQEHVVTAFGPRKWSGEPGNGAGNLFLGSWLMVGLLCWIVSWFVPSLSFLLGAGIATVVATAATIADVASTSKRERRYFADLLAQVNEFILQVTGDPNAQVSASRLRALILQGRGLPLQINGVPGVELVTVRAPEVTRIVAVVTAPDYGLESFDVVLKSGQQQ